jgi:hypothetical protein
MNKKKINIIYLLPTQKTPSGGSGVIYKHSSIINNFDNNFSSEILHYKKKKIIKFINSLKKIFKIKDKSNNFGYKFNEIKIVKNFNLSKDWIHYKFLSRKKLYFNSEKDFIILPEIIAHFAEELCIKKKIKYAIFVQGVYHMNQTSNISLLKKSYANAEFIIFLNQNTKKKFDYIFPKLNKNTLISSLSINNNLKIKKNKKNIITCMPKKLIEDFHLLNLFNINKIPKNWKVKILYNLTNEELTKNLMESRIFLSFSNFEGTGLPPLEAALSGNKVIGYSGNGGDAYFKKPIFEKIKKGDILSFSKSLNNNVKNLEKYWHLKKQIKSQRHKIYKYYSAEKEINSVKKMLSKIYKIMK